MRKFNNYQHLADLVVKSAIKWAENDAHLDAKEKAASENFRELEDNFNMFVQQKYGSPHDFVVIKEETLRNRYDEMYYILGEVLQHGVMTDRMTQLNAILLVIADNIPGFEDDEESGTDNESEGI